MQYNAEQSTIENQESEPNRRSDISRICNVLYNFLGRLGKAAFDNLQLRPSKSPNVNRPLEANLYPFSFEGEEWSRFYLYIPFTNLLQARLWRDRRRFIVWSPRSQGKQSV